MKLIKFLLIAGLTLGLSASVNSCATCARKNNNQHSGLYKNSKKSYRTGSANFKKKKHFPHKWKSGPLPKNKK